MQIQLGKVMEVEYEVGCVSVCVCVHVYVMYICGGYGIVVCMCTHVCVVYICVV